MYYVRGKVLNIINKKPYTNPNTGETIEQVDVDVKDDSERFFQTVSCDPSQIENLEVGDDFDFPVSVFSGVSKKGKPYQLNKLMSVDN